MADERAATFWMQGWEGKTGTPCLVIGETAKRYRVRLISKSKLPGRNRWGEPGQVVLMPKRALTFASPPSPSS